MLLNNKQNFQIIEFLIKKYFDNFIYEIVLSLSANFFFAKKKQLGNRNKFLSFNILCFLDSSFLLLYPFL